MIVEIKSNLVLKSGPSQWSLVTKDGSGIAITRSWLSTRPPAAGTTADTETQTVKGKPVVRYRHTRTDHVAALHYGTLADAASGMIVRGYIGKKEAQSIGPVIVVASRILDNLRTLCGASSPRGVSITFGGGRFTITANTEGGWRLTGFPSTVYPGDLLHALFTVAERVFKDQPGPVEYQNLTAEFVATTKTLFSDAVATFSATTPRCQCEGVCTSHALRTTRTAVTAAA
jgi:hypothetical protein